MHVHMYVSIYVCLYVHTVICMYASVIAAAAPTTRTTTTTATLWKAHKSDYEKYKSLLEPTSRFPVVRAAV